MRQIAKWNTFEISFSGPQTGNPFKEQQIEAVFSCAHDTKKINGFYDGNGVYKIRFMPEFEGEYNYVVNASFPIEEANGKFFVLPAKSHGPVSAAYTYHFSYTDGTMYYPIGTTCYAWIHQPEKIREQTLDTLKNGPFNKIRMCVFPKHYDYNFAEPELYPFPAKNEFVFDINRDNFKKYSAVNTPCIWNFDYYNTDFFKHLDDMVLHLMELDIEADIILFHPYDRWGFSNMTSEQDAAYLKYVIARLSAYRNVWWSLANEWDFVGTKNLSDWNAIGETVVSCDPYHHMLSNHNGRHLYDYSKPWIKHCCVQRQDDKPIENIVKWRSEYHKPIIIDEMCYEGDLCHKWGNIDAEELIRRFWQCTLNGGYGGHGETFAGEQVWWSHGGILHGESVPRLAFLLKILKQMPAFGLTPVCNQWGVMYAGAEQLKGVKEYRLYYYDIQTPSYMVYDMPSENSYEVELIDTWNMSVTKLGTYSGKFRIEMPKRRYMAVQLIRR